MSNILAASSFSLFIGINFFIYGMHAHMFRGPSSQTCGWDPYLVSRPGPDLWTRSAWSIDWRRAMSA